jgi:iron complex outermembrane recepter protein
VVGGPIAGQVNNYVGGNINLTPEKSTTKSFGAVLKPRFLPGFSATIDYYDITVKNAIFAVPEQEIVDACYFTERNANGFFCQKIIRNPLDGSLIGGTETGVDATNINAGFLRNEGIDIGVQYRFDVTDSAKLTLALNATHTLKSQFQAARLPTPTPVRQCEGNLGSICLRPLPTWQWVQSTTLETGPWTVQLRWQHIGKLTNDTVAFGTAAPTDFAVPVIGARDYFDLYTSVDVSDNVGLRFGITNLLDKGPPVVGNDYGGTAENSGNTFPATYDPLGRSFFVGATLRF